MKKILTREFKIGVSVIIAILILIYGIDYLKGINVFKPTNYYVAHYENVMGLEVSAPITIDGYKVGVVREINFNYENPGKIEVVLAVDKDLKLPADSYAEIATTMLSGAYINIHMGKDKTMIPIGGEIRSETSFTINSMIYVNGEDIRHKLNEMYVNLAKISTVHS